MPRAKRGRPAGAASRTKSRGTQTTYQKKLTNKTKKQAYSKGVKRSTMLRRAAVVETKQRVDADIAYINGHTEENDWAQPLSWKPLGYSPLQGVADLGTNAFTWIPLQSFTRNSLGLQEYQMVGQNITSKFLKVKVQFRFPNNQYILTESGKDIEVATERNMNVFIQNQCKLYFICGWVTKDMGRPIQISQTGDGLLASQVTEASLARYVCDQVEPYFNDDEDKLQFRPKTTTNIKIEHYSRVKPNLTQTIPTQGIAQQTWTNNLGEDINLTSPTGSIPDVYKSWTFKPNRKVQYTLGTPAEENAAGKDTQNFYPNDTWLPFCIAYNPDYEELLKQWEEPPSPGSVPYVRKVCQIQFRHNSAHYYTDS